jgi:hypothetical protein
MRDFFSPVLILDLWSQMAISGAMVADGRAIAAGEFKRPEPDVFAGDCRDLFDQEYRRWLDAMLPHPG